MKLEHLEKIQSLTKEYAQFAKQKAGLGYLAIIPIFLGANQLGKLLPISFLGTLLGIVLTAFFTALWWFIRQQSIIYLYQGFGQARAARVDYPKDFWRSTVLGILAGVAIGLLLAIFIGKFEFPNTMAFAAPIMVFSVFLMYRIYQTSGFLLSTTSLIFGAALAGGLNSNATNLTELQRFVSGLGIGSIFMTIGLVSIAFGQHLDYLKLVQAFKNLSGGTP